MTTIQKAVALAGVNTHNETEAEEYINDLITNCTELEIAMMFYSEFQSEEEYVTREMEVVL